MDLLERFARGDLDAFETLFRQFEGDVYRWALRLVRDPATAEDVTIEAFWRIYCARARFDARRPFGAWARRIACNVAIDHLKRDRRREAMVSILRRRPPVSASAAGHDVEGLVRSAIRELPPRLHAVATLAIVEEVPHAEIATALGISESAVKARRFRAVRLLRRKLEKLGVMP